MPLIVPDMENTVIISGFFSFVNYALKIIVLFGAFLKLKEGDIAALQDVLTCGVFRLFDKTRKEREQAQGESLNIPVEPDNTVQKGAAPQPLQVQGPSNSALSASAGGGDTWKDAGDQTGSSSNDASSAAQSKGSFGISTYLAPLFNRAPATKPASAASIASVLPPPAPKTTPPVSAKSVSAKSASASAAAVILDGYLSTAGV